MSLLTRIATALEPNSQWRSAPSAPEPPKAITHETRSAPGLEIRAGGVLDTGGTSGFNHQWKKPPMRGTEDILAAYVVSPMLRACVQRVVQSFARVRYYVDERGDENYTHPIIQQMDNYNPLLIGSQGRRLEQTYFEVCGEAITVVMPSGKPGRAELWPVSPTWVTLESTAGKRTYCVQINGRQYEFGAHEVLHRRDIDLVQPYGRGRGGALAVADEIESDEYASKHTKAYFFNSTVPEFIATIKGANEAQARALKGDYLARHQGWDKAWQPMFTPFEMQIHELTRKIGDERIEEMRKYWSDVVRWMYGVPPEIIGMVENSNRATIREAKEIMGEYVTDPRCQYYQETWQHAFGGGSVIRYDSPIPKIFNRRDEIMQKSPYHFTRNEVRREAGLKDVRDGDVYVVPVNMQLSAAQRSLRDCGRETQLRLVEDTHG